MPKTLPRKQTPASSEPLPTTAKLRVYTTADGVVCEWCQHPLSPGCPFCLRARTEWEAKEQLP